MVEKNTEMQVRENVSKLRNMEMSMAFAQEQLQNLERALIEINATKVALNAMKDLKKDAPSIMSLGTGVYAAGVLQKQDKVLVESGAGIILERPLDDVFKLLEEKEATVRKNVSLFQQQLGGVEKEYQELSAETQRLAKK